MHLGFYCSHETRWQTERCCRWNGSLLSSSYTADCSSDPVTISLQAGWAVTPASGPTGQSECFRAGSRWPSWCHTDSQSDFNCPGLSLAQWAWIAGLKIGPEEEGDLVYSNDLTRRIPLYAAIKRQQSKPLRGRHRRWWDFTGPLSLSLSPLSRQPLWLTVSTAALTAHSHSHTPLHMQTRSSPGHDSSLGDSSECAALTSVDSTVCHALSTSVCAVVRLDRSQISSALHKHP